MMLRHHMFFLSERSKMLISAVLSLMYQRFTSMRRIGNVSHK